MPTLLGPMGLRQGIMGFRHDMHRMLCAMRNTPLPALLLST